MASVLSECGGAHELYRILGDAVDQAALWAGISMTSTPFWNVMPRTTFGYWFSPFNRRQVLAAAETSLKTRNPGGAGIDRGAGRDGLLRSIVDRIEVDEGAIRLFGRKDVLEQCIMAGTVATPGVRTFVPEWRTRHDSNV
jgi:hypothetical protein